MTVFIIGFLLIKCCIGFIRLYKIKYSYNQYMEQSHSSENIPYSKQSEQLYSEPSYGNIKRKGKSQEKQRKKKGKLWKSFQERQYIAFIRNNLKTLSSNTLRRKKKIFEMMAKKVPTRTARQCRSHHQKMVLKYGNEQNIASLYVKQRQGKKKCRVIQMSQSQTQSDSKAQNQNIDSKDLVELPNSQELSDQSLFDDDMNDSFQIIQDLRLLKSLKQDQKLQLITEGMIHNQTSDFFRELLQQD